MDSEQLDHVKSLHTNAVDARKGYEEALQDAGPRGLTGLFRDTMVIHQTNADELTSYLIGAGETATDQGSFMSTVHRSIMSIRSLFGGLDESVLPGLIDGEERNVKTYEQALGSPLEDASLRQVLSLQRDRLQGAIASMRRQRTQA